LDNLTNFKLYKRQRTASGNTNQVLVGGQALLSSKGFLVFKDLSINVNKNKQKEIWLYGNINRTSKNVDYKFQLVDSNNTDVRVVNGKKRPKVNIKINDADGLIKAKIAERLPVVIVSSPKDNEVYSLGQEVAIQWRTNMDLLTALSVSMSVDLIKQNIISVYGLEDIKFDFIADVIAPTSINDGSKQWTIPNDLDKEAKYYISVNCIKTLTSLPAGCSSCNSGVFSVK